MSVDKNIYCLDTYLYYLSFHWQSTQDENWIIWCGCIWRHNSCLYIFTVKIICIMFFFLNPNNRAAFQWNVDTYGNRSHSYILRLCIWLICCFIDSHDSQAQSRVSSKGHILFILLCSNPHISSLLILNQNPRLSSHTIGVMHSNYFLLLLVSGDCPLTTKMGVCWNLLESTPARIPLIDSSHK